VLWESLHPEEFQTAVIQVRHRSDPVLPLYRDSKARDEVVAFFATLVHSQELASVILQFSDEFNVSPALAFALGWEESRFKAQAINKNAASVDRGIFQLNSKSFPKLKEADFYDIGTNSRLGIAHLRWCLDLAGSEVAGLAMYNAGTTRVRSDGTPKKTLDYVSRIQDFRDGIHELFSSELAARWVIVDGEAHAVAPRKPLESRFSSARFPVLNILR
jgi:soluble lytic murein transglycosylase-like protein